jgi:DNA-directed RNA polymerase subunit RPC12/RpoP
MKNQCPQCSKELNHIYKITGKSASGSNQYYDLYRCPACAGRFLYVSTNCSSGENSARSTVRYTLTPEEAAMLTRVFYQCPKPFNSSCTCPAHAVCEGFVATHSQTGKSHAQALQAEQ